MSIVSFKIFENLALSRRRRGPSKSRAKNDWLSSPTSTEGISICQICCLTGTSTLENWQVVDTSQRIEILCDAREVCSSSLSLTGAIARAFTRFEHGEILHRMI